VKTSISDTRFMSSALPWRAFAGGAFLDGGELHGAPLSVPHRRVADGDRREQVDVDHGGAASWPSWPSHRVHDLESVSLGHCLLRHDQIQVMDAMRTAKTANGGTTVVDVDLFPAISIGDAPVRH